MGTLLPRGVRPSSRPPSSPPFCRKWRQRLVRRHPACTPLVPVRDCAQTLVSTMCWRMTSISFSYGGGGVLGFACGGGAPPGDGRGNGDALERVAHPFRISTCPRAAYASGGVVPGLHACIWGKSFHGVCYFSSGMCATCLCVELPYCVQARSLASGLYPLKHSATLWLKFGCGQLANTVTISPLVACSRTLGVDIFRCSPSCLCVCSWLSSFFVAGCKCARQRSLFGQHPLAVHPRTVCCTKRVVFAWRAQSSARVRLCR